MKSKRMPEDVRYRVLRLRMTTWLPKSQCSNVRVFETQDGDGTMMMVGSNMKTTQSKKDATYPAARAEAQAKANLTGHDYGLEWNSLLNYWSIFILPQRQNRYGFELRCEVVSCTDLSKRRVGHGPK